MSHIYFVLGVIGWILTPTVILAYAIWPRGSASSAADSKQQTFP